MLAPVAVQVVAPGVGSRDEITFGELCVMVWVISSTSLEQVVTPLSSLCLSQGDKWARGCSVPQFPCL